MSEDRGSMKAGFGDNGRRAAPLVRASGRRRCLLLATAAASALLFSMPEDAAAGTCNGAAPPYTIPTQNAQVGLDVDCAGAGGRATVTGNVDGGALNAIQDPAGGDQDWAIFVNPGVSVTTSGANATILFMSPNGSVDNSGTIQSVNANAIWYSAGVADITNRNGGQILSGGAPALNLGAGGTVLNEAGALIQSTGSGAINSVGLLNLTNAGTINAANNNSASGNSGATVVNSGTILGRLNFFTGGTLSVTNSGTMTGDTGNEAIRANGISSTIVNSGTINAGTGSTFAISYGGAAGTHVLELQPGFTINGIVGSGAGTDTLRFGGTGDGTFNLDNIDQGGNTQQYRSFDTFSVTGGDWDFSGTTTQTFSVSGGSVGGTGTFAGLNILSGGKVAPGNSIGTLNVGNIVFNTGSIYEVEVNAAGQSDLVNATGTATINGGTVSVQAASGDYGSSTTYTILTATGGRTGTFDGVTSNFAFLDPSLAYDANNVFLTLERNTRAFASLAQTANQLAVANALNASPTSSQLYQAVLTQSAAGARKAFDALSGEVHGSLGAALLGQSHHLRDAVNGRLLQAAYGGAGLGGGGPQNGALEASSTYGSGGMLDTLTVWAEGFGAWGDMDGNGNAASLDRDIAGIIAGLDAEVAPGWRAGIAGGYSHSDLDEDARLSSASVDAYHILAYGSGEIGSFALRGGAGWTFQNIDTTRSVVFPGFSELETASYDGDRGQVFGEVAYRMALGGGLAAEPFAGLAYVHQETGGFTESGPVAGLTSPGYDESVGYSTLGLRAAATMNFWGAAVTPRVSAAWLHAFGDVDSRIRTAFASTGAAFNVAGTPLAQDSALLEAGLDVSVGAGATLGVSYTGQFGDGLSENGVKGRFSYAF